MGETNATSGVDSVADRDYRPCGSDHWPNRGAQTAFLVLWLVRLAAFFLACILRLTGRFGHVFERCVEAFLGIVRLGLFGRFPKLLNLGFLRHASILCSGRLSR